MPERDLHLCLPAHLQRAMDEGRSNILSRLSEALEPVGWRFHHHPENATPPESGYSLLHMREPLGARSLCLRRAYHYPFWRIEPTNERWHFAVAKARFDAATIPAGLARAFARRWATKLLGKARPHREGFIFMPLQGRLTEHRSFQSMSPLAMVTATLSADRRRAVCATLHPNEVYDPQEIEALSLLSQQMPRFQLVKGDAADLVMRCDYVVTQNSAVALTGYFARKPAVLFAKIDFHHIAGSVPHDGLEAAFAKAQGVAPDFAAYLYWFFKLNSINAASDDAVQAIRARLAHFGWPI